MTNTIRKHAFLAAVVAVVMMASCSTPADIAYINDMPRDSAMVQTGQFSKGIQPNDLIYIYVESRTPEATIRFNQETNKVAVSSGAVMNPGTNVNGYLVSNDGNIIFPVLGKIQVAGKTHSQLAAELEQRLVSEGHILDAVVTVKLLNFKVSILGDVTRPGVLEVSGERLTIFEAISMAGDLTIFGQRKNVTVIREENGQRVVGELDLTSKDVFNSPYYYLHQNDVVYVEPNKKKKRTSDRDPMLLTYISTGVSVLSMLLSAYYYYILSKKL